MVSYFLQGICAEVKVMMLPGIRTQLSDLFRAALHYTNRTFRNMRITMFNNQFPCACVPTFMLYRSCRKYYSANSKHISFLLVKMLLFVII